MIEEVLQKIFYYDNPNEVSILEAAEAIGKHERSVYYYVEGEREIKVDTLRQLALYLAEEYDDCRIAEFFLPEGFQIVRTNPVTNGSIVDEVLAISEAEGQAISADRRGDHNELRRKAEEIIRQGVALKAEANRMMHNKKAHRANGGPSGDRSRR